MSSCPRFTHTDPFLVAYLLGNHSPPDNRREQVYPKGQLGIFCKTPRSKTYFS